MKITKRQLRKIIKEAIAQSYDLGREDSLAGIRPQLPDEDYMRGYNEAQMDAGMPTMQAPRDSGRGKKLDPDLLKGALPGKIRGMYESKINERRMATDVFKIVARALNHGPQTHQQLLANILDAYPNTSDEEIDSHIDQLEDSGDIIFNPSIQKYQ